MEVFLLNKTALKTTFFIIISEVILSIIITIAVNKLNYSDRTFFHNYIDFIFFVNLPMFILGSIMFLSESGLFNVFVYSTYKVRSVISEKYRYTLRESSDIEDYEIEEHLKEKYLYNKSSYSWTLPIFYASALIFICIILSVSIFYGL